MENEILQTLKENQKLLEKQVKAAKFRNGILTIALIVFVGISVFTVSKINEVMLTVNDLQTLTNEISDELAQIDVDTLNSAITNFDDVTSEMSTAISKWEEVTNSFAKLFRF